MGEFEDGMFKGVSNFIPATKGRGKLEHDRSQIDLTCKAAVNTPGPSFHLRRYLTDGSDTDSASHRKIRWTKEETHVSPLFK